jgi:BirA family biotin operon repressor/biotin-[acetyl-CoA-carboxylase] ligase
MPFARTIVHRRSVDSTNSLARRLLLQGFGELPLLVWADMQTVGKGQRNSQWWSDDGSLTFSIGIDPVAHGLRIDQEPRLSLVTALAIVKAINSLGWAHPGIGIRWPNDVEAGGRKLGGILPERIETDLGHRVIVGVGLNVLTRLDQAPLEVQRMATSLAALQGSHTDQDCPARLLARILDQLDCEVRALAICSPEQAREWNTLSLLNNRVARISIGSQVIVGRVQAIDVHGALCLTELDGLQRHRLFGGQVLRDG